jgi:hypothetical protein
MDDNLLAEDSEREAQDYLEALMRDHLEDTMDDCQGEAPMLLQHYDIDQLRNSISKHLREGGNSMLAVLVEAAVNIKNAADNEDDKALDHFLERAINTLRIQTLEPFLSTILVGLLERSHLDEDMTSSASHSPIETSSGITITCGNRVIEVPFDEVLSSFWGPKLNSNCERCLCPIVDGPPIRTISQQAGSPSLAKSISHIRVINRHFSCLRRAYFVPVSHVWEDSVRRANDDETKSHHEDAAAALIRTLEALFSNSEGAYGPVVEFWHDYFSVPQWEKDTKESLLLHLPAIYRAREIIVHLSDISPHCVALLLMGSMTGPKASMTKALKRIRALMALSKSAWMHRMWVTLEYSQCMAACVLDGSNNIWRSIVGPGFFSNDTFTRLLGAAHDQSISLYGYSTIMPNLLDNTAGFLGEMAKRKSRRDHYQKCLGRIVEIVAKKNAHLFRDRFLAIHSILNGKSSPENPVSIPSLEADACAWVWHRALSRGDYSPLLLQPQEKVSFSNPGLNLYSWAVGYRGLEGACWDLGAQCSLPRNNPIAPQPRILGDTSQLTTHAVLESVGVIESIHYLPVEDSGEVAGVEWTLGLLRDILHAESTTLSPATLMDGLRRIFDFQPVVSKPVHLIDKDVLSFARVYEQ